MKNRALKILAILTLAILCATCFFACGKSKTPQVEVTLKEQTELIGTNGGMIADTTKYIYFINGVGDSTGDNTFGAPVKSALYALDKSDMTTQSVVVPKLFVSTDYNAGVYIYDGYVYYGTASTDKNSSGAVANDKLVIAKTKLDGTGTEILLTLGDLATQFRIVKGSDNLIYVVYYDTADTAIKCFNLTSKQGEPMVVAKTDVKATKESLKDYKFVNNVSLNSCAVIYTTTVYAVDYNETEAENANYQRLEHAYNKVYAYMPGDAQITGTDLYGKLVLDGGERTATKIVDEKYAFTKIIENRLFYSVTKNDGSEAKTYAIDVDKLCAKDFTYQATVTNTAYLSVSIGDCLQGLTGYYVDDSSKNIMKTTLTGTAEEINKNTVAIAKGDSVSSFLQIKGDYIYFIDSANKIQRVYVGGDAHVEQNVERVSSGETLKNFYAPEFVTVNGKTYLFYIDASAQGCSYVAYANIDSVVTKEDTDEDGKNDLFYISETKIIGEMAKADKVKALEEKITAIADSCDSSGKLKFDETTDGSLKIKAIDEVRALYDSYASDSEIYDAVAEDKITTLTKYEKAYEISKLLYKLKDFQALDSVKKDALKAEYEAAKTYIEAFFNADTSENHADYEAVLDLVVKDLNYQYGRAKIYFNKTAEQA